MQNQWGLVTGPGQGRVQPGLKPLVTKETDHPGTTDWILPASKLGWGRHLL